MSTIRVSRLRIQREGTDPVEAQRLARSIAERLGAALADGAAVRPRRAAVVDVTVPQGLSGDRLAAHIAREIRRHLG